MFLSDNIIKAKDVKVIKGTSGDTHRNSAKVIRTWAAPARPLPAAGERSSDKNKDLLDKLKKEMYEKGFADGLKSKEKEISAALGAISAALAKITKLKEDFYSGVEEKMLDLVFAVAGKVINMEISTNREVVLAILREAIAKVTEVNSLKIIMNPDDLSFISERKQDIFRGNSLLENAIFEGNPNVQRGGVLLETDNFEIDARLDHRYDIIKKALTGNQGNS